MTDEKELLRKVTHLFDESRKRKIIDYDSGLLHDIFEPITGTAEEKFDRWSDRLIRVAARLENLYKKKTEKPEILEEIHEFFDTLELPYITSEVKDRSVTIEHGRTITIKRGDSDQNCSCPVEIFNDISLTIRHEQYLPLIAHVKMLFYKAVAVLESTEFTWHREDLFEEINPEKEETKNGRNTESESPVHS